MGGTRWVRHVDLDQFIAAVAGTPLRVAARKVPDANLIAWLPHEAADVKGVEVRLLREFRDEHGVLPFANLRL